MKDVVIDIPTFDDMLDAYKRTAHHIHRTPMRTSDYLSEVAGCDLFFQCENFQEPGAFKVRGATNAVFGLNDEQAIKGVVTPSSGNHASCLSYAAMRRGIPYNVVMPRTAPPEKKDAVRRHGGVITECKPSTTSREATFAEVEKASGGDFVHPHNDPRVIAGRGTFSNKILEQTGGLDMIIAPIGVGGMIPGICATLSKLAAETEIIAAEPEQADDAYRSFKADHIIADDAPQTITDGLLVRLKERTWHFISNYMTDIFTESEQEIIYAIKLTWKHLRIVMEPSCAVPLAILLKNSRAFKGKQLGIIVTGGNVDLDKLPWIYAA